MSHLSRWPGISPQSGSNEITGLPASARPLINMIKRLIAANRRQGGAANLDEEQHFFNLAPINFY